MENYPSNSKTGREEPQEPKKVEKIVTGKAVFRKKPLGRRFMETFVGGSDASSVWGYVFYDVLVPAAKDMVFEAFSQGIERTLFGESRGRGGSRSRASSKYTSYNRYSAPGPMTRREEPQREISRQGRASHNFDELVIPTKVEAEEVIDRLFGLVDQYDTATVADLYELAGLSGNFTDEKWGWTDMRGSSITRIRNGYLLNLPKPEPLN